MNWLLEPLQFAFMQQALVIGLFVTIPAAALSCLLVLKGWSLMGDAVSHAVLPGVVIAYVAGIPILVGAFISGMICAALTGFLSTNSRLKEDTVMGVVFSGMFALGIVLFSYIHTNIHLDQVLFGNILGITWQDVLVTAILNTLVLLLFLLKRNDILVYAFDPQHASVVGLSINWMHYGLLAMLSMVIVSSINAVGIILVIAVLIAPGAISFLLTDRFHTMLWLAMFIAALCSVTGIVLSYHIDSAPAPTIVVIMSVVFIIAFIWAPKRGLVSINARQRHQTQNRPS